MDELEKKVQRILEKINAETPETLESNAMDGDGKTANVRLAENLRALYELKYTYYGFSNVEGKSVQKELVAILALVLLSLNRIKGYLKNGFHLKLFECGDRRIGIEISDENSIVKIEMIDDANRDSEGVSIGIKPALYSEYDFQVALTKNGFSVENGVFVKDTLLGIGGQIFFNVGDCQFFVNIHHQDGVKSLWLKKNGYYSWEEGYFGPESQHEANDNMQFQPQSDGELVFPIRAFPEGYLPEGIEAIILQVFPEIWTKIEEKKAFLGNMQK